MALTRCHVIVIGAGIGGLTAALSLQRHGFKVSVYEQASELREFGAGLLVTPNAMRALEFLGIGEVIAATSNVSNELLIRHFQSGRLFIVDRPVNTTSQNTMQAISRFIVRTFITL